MSDAMYSMDIIPYSHSPVGFLSASRLSRLPRDSPDLPYGCTTAHRRQLVGLLLPMPHALRRFTTISGGSGIAAVGPIIAISQEIVN